MKCRFLHLHIANDDLTAGLVDGLFFDLNDVSGEVALDANIFSGFDDNVVNVSDVMGVYEFYENVSFGDATVVSTPVTLVLFLTAVAGLPHVVKIANIN